MKYAFYLLFIIPALLSCNNAGKQLHERIVDSDSVAINYFKGDGTMDTVVAVKIISDRKYIEQLAALVSYRDIEKDVYKCGFDGSLHFFKMNKVIQDVDFRMNAPECMCFSFLRDGKTHATTLSAEAKELLTALRK